MNFKPKNPNVLLRSLQYPSFIPANTNCPSFYHKLDRYISLSGRKSLDATKNYWSAAINSVLSRRETDFIVISRVHYEDSNMLKRLRFSR